MIRLIVDSRSSAWTAAVVGLTSLASIATGLLIATRFTSISYGGAIGLMVVLLVKWPEVSLGIATMGSLIWPLIAPVGLIITGFGTAVAMGAATAGILLKAFISRRAFRIRMDKLDAAVLTFLFYMSFSLWWSPAQGYGLDKLAGFVLLSVVPYFLVRHFCGHDPLLLWRTIVAGVGFAVVGIVVLTEASRTVGTFWPDYYWALRRDTVERLGISIFGLADTVSLALVCAGGLLLRFRHLLVRLILLTVCLGCLWALLALGERGQIIGSTLGVAMLVWYYSRSRPLSPRRTVLAIVALTIVLLIPLLGSFRFSKEYLSQDISVFNRIAHLRSGFELFLTSPFVGVGLGGYATALGRDQRFFVHNILLEVLVEGGLMGLLLLLFLMVLVLRRLADYRELPISSLTSLGVTATALFVNRVVVGFLSNDLQNLSWGLYLGLAVAVLDRYSTATTQLQWPASKRNSLA